MNLPTLATLASCLDRLTSERQRPQLEKLLVEAVRDLLSARRVAYYRLLLTPEETLFWLAVEIDSTGIRVLDDGINPSGKLCSTETRLEIDSLIANDALFPIPTNEPIRLAQSVSISGAAAGFIELDVNEMPDAEQRLVFSMLLGSFRNLMSLLDYSEVDTLTGLLNRKTFDEHLINILASLIDDDDSKSEANHLPKRRYPSDDPTSHWLAVIDIDHFKRINDDFGHLIGDEVLLLVANLMKNSFRFRDKLFRFGGEEFVVVLKPTGKTQALTIFERFRAAMEGFAFPQVGRVTISIGFAPIRLHDQPSLVLDCADQALYWAKEHGRNRVAAYDTLIDSGDLAPLPVVESDIELF